MDKLKVLVVDDSVLYRKILTEAVEGTGLASVEQTASNGMITLERLAQRTFDVVLLDVIMPQMDGIDTLEAIKRSYPQVTVIMISGGSEDSAAITVRALAMGAMDFLLKPMEALSWEKSMEMIRRHLHVLFVQIQISRSTAFPVKPHPVPEVPEPISGSRTAETVERVGDVGCRKIIGVDLVVIASSTGGPNALDTLCSNLPRNFSKPILVVQHMPPTFTRILAQSMDRKCLLKVSEAQEGDGIRKGEILIAPGGFHMTVQETREKGRIIRLENSPQVNGVRPAADVLFRSVARSYKGEQVLAVIMTGMGSDGMEGIRELKRNCQCYSITQSEQSCVVYGMPKSVVEAGLSDETADLKDMAGRIQHIVSGRS